MILSGIIALSGWALASGCRAPSAVQMMPFDTQRLKPTDSLLIEIKPDRCYYWVDEDRLCVALTDSKPSILGTFYEREFNLSFVLEGLPAGAGRTYQADRRTMRLRWRHGLANFRTVSLSGIVSVWDYGKRQLHGKFRINGKQQSYFVLTGWGGDVALFMVGEFTATENREAGQAILDKTEEGSMDRSAVPPQPRVIRISPPPSGP